MKRKKERKKTEKITLNCKVIKKGFKETLA